LGSAYQDGLTEAPARMAAQNKITEEKAK
jgi:hypothetical protein